MYVTYFVWRLHVCTRFQEKSHDFDVGIRCSNGKCRMPTLLTRQKQSLHELARENKKVEASKT